MLRTLLQLVMGVDEDPRTRVPDPLSTIIRLAIYGCKPEGTKISIHGNRIHFHEFGSLQGAIRFMHGDSKNDLHYLYLPIETACQWYLSEELSDTAPVREVFQMAIEGLRRLDRVYHAVPLIRQCLTWYVQVIEHYLHSSQPYKVSQDIVRYGQDLIAKLRTIWNDNQIAAVVHLLRELRSSKSSNDITHLSDAVEQFLGPIDHRVQRLAKSIEA